MAVFVEAISVIIKRDAIENSFPGGWEGFVGDAPNKTLCADAEIARIGFMDGKDMEVYISRLVEFGLIHLQKGKAQDIVIIDQQQGPSSECEWIEFGHIPLDDEGTQVVAACRFKGSTSQDLIFPDGWEYDRSLSKSLTYVPRDRIDDRLELNRRENGLDVYLDRKTGKEVYTGRTDSGDIKNGAQ